MKRILPVFSLLFLLAGCDWTVNPQPFPVWTPIPSRTPGIVSPTPVIVLPTIEATLPLTQTPEVTATPTETLTPEPTPTATPFQAIEVQIIGCNTGLDITHGMGEVTNAYVALKNTGTLDLPDACGLLRAQDEDREHPDKTRCVDNLPAGYQVTLKLTVDSTFHENTAIQIDASSAGVLLARIDSPACTDLDILGSVPGDAGQIKPIVP